MSKYIKRLIGVFILLSSIFFGSYETFYFGNNLTPHSAMEFGADVLALLGILVGFGIIQKSNQA